MSKQPQVRPSQLITTYGPGAIIDLKYLSVMVGGLEDWRFQDPEDRIDEPRLARSLDKDCFYKPSCPTDDNHGEPSVPVRLFPLYFVCPSCHILAPASQFRYDKEERCFLCTCSRSKPVIAHPSRFIVACPKGHIADFPWLKFVHAKSGSACVGPLRQLQAGLSGSIMEITIKCDKCKMERHLGEAFNSKKKGVAGLCAGNRPWLGYDNIDAQTCDEPWQALLRGASNVYFPLIRSSIAIPPWTSLIQTTIGRRLRDLAEVKDLNKMKLIGSILPDLKEFDPEELFVELNRRRGLTPPDPHAMLYEEWQALRDKPQMSGEYFETEKMPVDASLKHWMKRVIAVKRLREVRVLTGFTRIDYAAEPGEIPVQSVETAPISITLQRWLPGIDNRGEGIFIEFECHPLVEWEKHPAVAVMAKSAENTYQFMRSEKGLKKGTFPGMRYILLHTLSHLLIRQLSIECGYSSSALRERIYCSTELGRQMAGILIYTASSDSEGSLGGLVALAEVQKFASQFLGALKQASLCSSDPLCADNPGLLHGSLNGSACHACLLISETSCERGNRFLDRNLIRPTFSGGSLAFMTSDLQLSAG